MSGRIITVFHFGETLINTLSTTWKERELRRLLLTPTLITLASFALSFLSLILSMTSIVQLVTPDSWESFIQGLHFVFRVPVLGFMYLLTFLLISVLSSIIALVVGQVAGAFWIERYLERFIQDEELKSQIGEHSVIQSTIRALIHDIPWLILLAFLSICTILLSIFPPAQIVFLVLNVAVLGITVIEPLFSITQLSFGKRIAMISKNKMLCMLSGATALGLFSIPIVGAALAPILSATAIQLVEVSVEKSR